MLWQEAMQDEVCLKWLMLHDLCPKLQACFEYKGAQLGTCMAGHIMFAVLDHYTLCQLV